MGANQFEGISLPPLITHASAMLSESCLPMAKSHWQFFCVLLAFIVGTSVPGCHRKSRPEIIYVGHVASFQGPDKLSGEHARQGIQMALEEAEGAEGTINDRRVEVIHVDCKGDLKAVEPATVRLVVVNRVVALLGGIDGVTTATMEGIAHNYEIPLITTGGMPGGKSNDYVFNTGLSPERFADALAEFASKRHSPPISKVAILADNRDQGWSNFMAGKIARTFKTERSALVGEWTYGEHRKGSGASEKEWEFRNSEDLKEALEQMKNRNPEAIFLVGFDSDLPRLRKDGLDAKLPVFLAGVGTPHQLPGDLSNHPIYWVTPCALPADKKNKEQKDFVARYECRFNEPPDSAAALAYDNTRILIDSLKRASSPKGAAIKQAIEDLKDFQSLTGAITFTKQDHWPDRPAFVVRIQEGKSEVVFP